MVTHLDASNVSEVHAPWIPIHAVAFARMQSAIAPEYLDHLAALMPYAEVVIINSAVLTTDGSDAEFANLDGVVTKLDASTVSEVHAPRIPICAMAVAWVQSAI